MEIYGKTRNTYAPDEEVVILLDISLSMETTDIAPSRLEFAKDALRSSLAPSWKKYGYVVFAGKPFILSPLSDDLDGLQKLIETTSTSLLRQDLPGTSGTNIWDALLAGRSLFSSWSGSKKMLLVTDGKANIWLDPHIATRLIRDSNISINILALGSLSGSYLSLAREEEANLSSSWGIDLALLWDITESTSGMLLHISSGDTSMDVSRLFGKKNFENTTEKNLPGSMILILWIVGYIYIAWGTFLWRKYRKI
jgi:Ca-activated chloride channel homolog